MASKPWQYTDNQFLNVTDNSYRLALHIGRYHNDALFKNTGVDAIIAAMYAFFNPLYLVFDAAFDQLAAAGGIREGGTLNLREQLRLLSSTKVRQWDIAVQNVYPLGTPRYMELFPDRRTPFQTGSQILRINAVNTLSINIGTDAALAAVKADVDSTYGTLNDALTAQGGNKSAQQIASEAVEGARVAMCQGMFADCGGLMQFYSTNPDLILPYFDTGAMQKGQQVVFTDNHVKQQAIHFIVKHTFAHDDVVEIENIGNTVLRFYLAANKNDAPSGIFFEAAPHTRQLAGASSLGSVRDTYLQVYNSDPVTEGQFVLDMNPVIP